MKEKTEKSEFIQSISKLIPSVFTKNCPICVKETNRAVVVNYLPEEPVEYFGYVMCLKCGYESKGGGILHDYFKAAVDAQRDWNESESFDET